MLIRSFKNLLVNFVDFARIKCKINYGFGSGLLQGFAKFLICLNHFILPNDEHRVISVNSDSKEYIILI